MTTQCKVYFNGKFVPQAEACISIFDSALIFGDLVFEVTRSFNGTPFRLRDHLERLYVGLKLLEIDPGMSMDEMEAVTLETIEVNRAGFPAGRDFQIMHSVSRGPYVFFRSAFPEGPRPTVVINCWPLTWHIAAVAEAYENGVHAVTPLQRSVPARLIDPKIKNRSRIHYQIANLQAQKVDPKAWALMLDEDGFLTEGTGANFFLVKNGRLLTPDPRNILRGVTRQAVMELAAEFGGPCQERNLEPYDAVTADEAFFTSTPFVLVPVTRFNGQPIGTGKVGPISCRLLDAWSRKVGVDIVAQAKLHAKDARG